MGRLLCGSLLILLFAAAQQPSAPPALPQPAPQQQIPAVRLTTRLVQVSVIADGKKGQPVTTLKLENFALYDDDQPQKISLFAMHTTQPESSVAGPPLPPNTFSNRYERAAGVPTSVTVVLLDALNTQFLDQEYARRQVIKFLQQVQPNDRVAIYALGRKLHVVHDFTSDTSTLLKALARFTGEQTAEMLASEPPPNDTGNTTLDALLDESDKISADFTVANRVALTVAALEAIANHVGSLPGRKNLVWVSGSFPFTIGYDTLLQLTPVSGARDYRTFLPEIQRAAEALNNADLAVYPVDARGLMGPQISAAQRTMVTGPRPGARPTGRPPSINPSRDNFDTMEILADKTGGRAFYNTNDIAGAIRRAVDDARVTYELGYYPDHNQWDGKFHIIKLVVKQPGVHLRWRKGYFALPDEAPSDARNRAALVALANSPLDSSEIGLVAHARLVAIPGSNSLRLEFQVAADRLSFEQGQDRWKDSLKLVYVQRDSTGSVLQGADQLLAMRLLPQDYEKAKKEGLTFTKELDLNSNANEVRILVQETSTGLTGSVTIPIARLQTAPNGGAGR